MSKRTPLYALYVADVISLAGNAVAQLAIPWFVLTTTGSASLTALAVFFNFLPIVIATFFGGVVVDRLGFRTTSVVADLASSAAVAAIPLLYSTVGVEIWQLMVLVFLGALLDAPGSTARAALLPDLVELAGVRMERASGIRSGIQQGAQLVGAPIGGLLVAGVGATNALWLDSASFLFSAALVALVVPRPAATVAAVEARGSFFAELTEGMRFIWNERVIRALTLTVLVTNLLEAPFPIVMTVFAKETYGSATDLGLMYGALGGGALAGALAYSSIGHRLPRRRTLVFCFAAIPLLYLALATLPPLSVALVVLAVFGLVSGPINPLLFTVTAERVPLQLRGRVFGAVRAGAWAAIPLGILVGGALVGAIGVAATFLTIGLGCTAVVGYGFFNPAFREMDG
ncbi:MAG TPA: MFS transporter [Gaiellaceae bacterium]|jgi:MFS family permease|nr:MFS transporter [Gaiellaceae bacterium]